MASTSRSKGRKRLRRVKQPKRNWLELPTDVTANILNRVGAIDIIENVQKVCTSWRSICKDPAMWRVIDMANHGFLHFPPYRLCPLEKMCRHAVDRSQGQSNQLRRLRFVSCYGITSNGLVQAVEKLPLLEVFVLLRISIAAKDIEVVGNSCPLLKSFGLNYGGGRSSVECDEAVLVIATSMPGLRHLQLLGNDMTNVGLKAILDRCSHLESLDIRQCNNVSLGGSLGKRCSEQIKTFKFDVEKPHNSFYDDYPYVDSPDCDYDGYISA